MTWSIRDLIVCVTLVGFVMFCDRFKDSKMFLYWHSNVTTEIVSVLPTPCGSVLSWAHILFSLVLGYVCVWQMYLKQRKKISIKTWMFLSYILQLKLNKRLCLKISFMCFTDSSSRRHRHKTAPVETKDLPGLLSASGSRLPAPVQRRSSSPGIVACINVILFYMV